MVDGEGGRGERLGMGGIVREWTREMDDDSEGSSESSCAEMSGANVDREGALGPKIGPSEGGCEESGKESEDCAGGAMWARALVPFG